MNRRDDHREPIIRFAHVSKAFGDHVVYRDLDLDVYSGETLTILGASGCGKSVALKLLIRLIECDSGSITFHGEEITTMGDARVSRLRQQIGMLFQGGALFDSLSVGENVAYGLRQLVHEERLDEAQIRARVGWALDLVGLPDIEPMLPAELSGGMKKRVGLARAVAVRPEVLLYDEPTTGLDPINSHRIANVITSLAAALAVTSIVVTHDLKSAFAISDRLALIHGGEILLTGTPDEFKACRDRRVVDFIEGAAPGGEDVATLLSG
ncbi:MAG TPA: ATP-binding cassette domain-containing protein [Byssovorax sp.]|jgi:phospholipid/cholesterol/gamma-HCH transport system ATP-binding protein